MKECSTPPSEAVEWRVDAEGISVVGIDARTAWEAHRLASEFAAKHGGRLPEFGSCRIKRTTQEDNPAKNG